MVHRSTRLVTGDDHHEGHEEHEAKLLTFMKLADVKIGLLINFNNAKLSDGIKRFVL